MKTLVHESAELLKPIIETIDRFGLKTHFLRKHKGRAVLFYDRLGTREYKTELAQKAQERFRRNQEKLFTFLDHDGIPWNNNNAEHAVKAFAALRNVIEPHSTESSICDYLVLLSICQTCEYRGIDFLQFLRSGEKRVDDYVQQSSRPKLRAPSRIRSRQPSTGARGTPCRTPPWLRNRRRCIAGKAAGAGHIERSAATTDRPSQSRRAGS